MIEEKLLISLSYFDPSFNDPHNHIFFVQKYFDKLDSINRGILKNILDSDVLDYHDLIGFVFIKLPELYEYIKKNIRSDALRIKYEGYSTHEINKNENVFDSIKDLGENILSEIDASSGLITSTISFVASIKYKPFKKYQDESNLRYQNVKKMADWISGIIGFMIADFIALLIFHHLNVFGITKEMAIKVLPFSALIFDMSILNQIIIIVVLSAISISIGVLIIIAYIKFSLSRSNKKNEIRKKWVG